MDMLVNLYRLPERKAIEGIAIQRVLAPDVLRVLAFVEKTFGAGWAAESRNALYAQPTRCFIAEKNGECVGFACYDATAKGYFGPIGVDESLRGSGIGRELLLSCLLAMREEGYGYAAIGWCDHAAPFYARTVGAVPIEGSEPEHTVYGRLMRFTRSDA
ncbi:MAG: GNAT family N-acetyltransferase [Clostridia bacterium]|nr:GNAT family N-acetyltransferase [Clostridia bacterium]